MSILIYLLIFVIYILSFNFCERNVIHYGNVYENGKLNFTSIGFKNGFHVEEHDVFTEDGYILRVFHIAGDRKRPVLLVHGMLDSADTFILRGNTSLAITLANKNYDVWAFNIRGNRYGRRHAKLNPDDDVQFWDYSFHEAGYYDLPATIDFILNRTSAKEISAVAHSQGNTIFYVMGSTRPEYNNKVKILIALAPICYLHNVKPPMSMLVSSLPVFGELLHSIGMEELFGDNSLLRQLAEMICTQKLMGYRICAHGILFPIGGEDPEELEPEFLPIVVGHYPSATSIKNGFHVAQVHLSKNFSLYDYGPVENMVKYNSVWPPLYDLDKVSMKVALFLGKRDSMSSQKDVELLRSKLLNVVDYRVLKRKEFNHIDYIWGRNMNRYLFPDILSVLDKYT